MGKISKTFEIKTLERRKDGGRILITTPSVDRDKDRVLPQGVKTDNYLRNPVVQWGHSYDEPWQTVGRTTNLEVTDKGITADFELRPAANESDPQNIVRLLWEGGWIKAASIGFIPSASAPNKEGGNDFTASELLEWSLVPIPANQTALALSAKSPQYKSLIDRALRAGGVSVAVKSPDYRLPDESPDACSARKIPELMEANPDLTEDEARAMAAEICAQEAPEAPADADKPNDAPTDEERQDAKAEGDALALLNEMQSLLDQLRAMAQPQDDGSNDVPSPSASPSDMKWDAAHGVIGKRGRVISAKNEEALRTAYQSIGRVLSQLDNEPEQSGIAPDSAMQKLGELVVDADTGNGLVDAELELESELLAFLEVMKELQL